jgi:hypothetical protein
LCWPAAPASIATSPISASNSPRSSHVNTAARPHWFQVGQQNSDALAMAVAYWAKALSVETEKVVQQNRDKLMQQELERYLRHAIGRKPTGRLFATTMHRR